MSSRNEMIQTTMERIKRSYQQQAKQQKSDDIIEFIKSNWKLFTARRSDMVTAVQSLGSPGVPYSVDGLCDVLGIPSNVLFKRSPVKDVGNAILDFPKTKLFELFRKCIEVRDVTEQEICLFVVAGLKSIVITNMSTSYCGGMMCYLPTGSHESDIHIFKAADAPYRLPQLFKHDEETYE